ncbi:MAG: hypothetical protein Q8Q50_03035 [Methylobacter sp.]|nr:hypothetical protein [Methylobacter sp.]
MTEKTASKYLLNLEKHFAADSPALLRASKVFQELDQIEYDLGLIGIDETTASKSSWWPIISLIGGNSTAKSRFINNYLGSDNQFAGIQTANHKFTVLLHSNQANPTTLPGTALDVDHRFPFYQISRQIEQQQAGEGDRINSYLELKTLTSDRLKSKLFIDAPNISAAPSNPVTSLLTKHIVENSDLVFVFTDIFDSTSPLVDELIGQIRLHQDSNKFVYLIDTPVTLVNSSSTSEIISSWQRKLAGLGLNTGQFIVLPSQDSGISTPTNFAAIDQCIANVGYDRTYRVINSLEMNIRELNNVVIPEVKKAIVQWKERSTFSSLIVLGFIATLAIFAEIQMGILELLIDPIIGPIIIITLIIIMVPVHIIFSKIHAKVIINQLNARQKELHLMENLSGIFEKNLTFSRMLLPISEPVGWNKKTKLRLSQISDKAKGLVQLLNDNFSTYDGQPSSAGYPDASNINNA